jgi:NAD(P)-dependent dehydrogenase (short-subunit alcohol dehydrogenase family)
MSKVWFITGSSRGLGRALAEAVLSAGHRLVATARRPDDLRDLVATAPDRVRAVALDVTDAAAARKAVAVATSAFGRLDVLVNNAGYANVGAFEDLAEDDFRGQVETDFFGVVNVTRAALPVMRAQRDGRIIQISSIGGRSGTPGLSAYQASKWAVGGFSEVVAAEVRPLGIRVTVVEPGGIRTDWAGSSMHIHEVRPEYESSVGVAARIRGNPDTMRGDPAKLARAILRVSEEVDPPLHLLLGSDAVFLAGAILERRRQEDERWKALSMSTDFDGLGDFKDTPIAHALMEMKR